MKHRAFAGWETVVALVLLFVIAFFAVATIVTNGRYVAVSAKKNSIDVASEEDSAFDVASAFFRAFENAFGDSVFLREYISPLASRLNTLLMGSRTVESTQVLLGKEDWLFYKSNTDGDSMTDYAGTGYFDDAKKAAIANRLAADQEKLNARGIELAVMIVPNKEQIYSKYMPDTVTRQSTVSRTDDLVEHIRQDGRIKLVYPKEEFLSLAGECQIYYKLDSHWNELGAYVGYQQLMEALFGERDYLQYKKYTSVEDVNREHADLLDMIGLYDWFGYDKFYSIDDPPEEKKPLTVLFVGDSCRISIEKYFHEGFEKAVVVHRDDYVPALLDEVQPDIVILEYVERYSGWMDDFSLVG